MDFLTSARLKRLILLSVVQIMDGQSAKTLTVDADWIYPSGIITLVLPPILFPGECHSVASHLVCQSSLGSSVVQLWWQCACWSSGSTEGSLLAQFVLFSSSTCDAVLIGIFIYGSRLSEPVMNLELLTCICPHKVSIYCLNLNSCRICALGKSASPYGKQRPAWTSWSKALACFMGGLKSPLQRICCAEFC